MTAFWVFAALFAAACLGAAYAILRRPGYPRQRGEAFSPSPQQDIGIHSWSLKSSPCAEVANGVQDVHAARQREAA
jgi:hypothetical protein